MRPWLFRTTAEARMSNSPSPKERHVGFILKLAMIMPSSPSGSWCWVWARLRGRQRSVGYAHAHGGALQGAGRGRVDAGLWAGTARLYAPPRPTSAATIAHHAVHLSAPRTVRSPTAGTRPRGEVGLVIAARARSCHRRSPAMPILLLPATTTHGAARATAARTAEHTPRGGISMT